MSDTTSEFKPGGGVPDGPVYVDRCDIEPVMTVDEAEALRRGPLPQWGQIGGYGSGTYEAKDPHGTIWRLWLVEQPADDDPLPPGYRLAPRDAQSNPAFVTREHGLYHALDTAGMQIAVDVIRDDPDGARRQLGLDG